MSDSVVEVFPKTSTPASKEHIEIAHHVTQDQVATLSFSSEQQSTTLELPVEQQDITNNLAAVALLLNQSLASTSTSQRDQGAACRPTRKRKRKEHLWKRNVTKKLRQSGQEYPAHKSGEKVPARSVNFTKNCKPAKCAFHCQRNVSKEQQKAICAQFWALGNEQSQKSFYDKTVQSKESNKRKRKDYKGKKAVSRSYSLIVGDRKIAVCQKFYLATLDVSKTRIDGFFSNRTPEGNPGSRKTHKAWNKTPDDTKDLARQHIASIPRVESHYCRSSTKREYVDGSLSVSKLYKLYVEWSVAKGYNRVSEYVYSELINTETNIAFHQPKKDRCDKCMVYETKAAQNMMTEEDRARRDEHFKRKEETRAQRKNDLEECNNSLVISFDLENVFSLPRSNVSSAFYKRKLNTYNLTAIVHKSKKGYCSIWSEDRSGRAANDIASALISNLNAILKDHPESSEWIIWSDSCVPQNRNSIMSYALQLFLSTSDTVCQITQRFSEPGHSSIQDVDSLHSCIERGLKGIEVHSPITLVRMLKGIKVNGQNMNVRILDVKEFYDYSSLAKLGTYKKVPFATVKELLYVSANQWQIGYKTSFSLPIATADVLQSRYLRNGQPKALTAPKCAAKGSLDQKKAKDLESLIPYMTGDDRMFMTALVSKHL